MLEESGFVQIDIGPPVDTFGGADGESKARLVEVFGYAVQAEVGFKLDRVGRVASSSDHRALICGNGAQTRSQPRLNA